MTIKEYQEKAMTTCLPTSNNFMYMYTNLIGEIGEFSSKVAKAIRKQQADIHRGNLLFEPELENDLKFEISDIFWQLNGLCSVLGWNVEEIYQMNLDKLASRKERDVLNGDGDNR